MSQLSGLFFPQLCISYSFSKEHISYFKCTFFPKFEMQIVTILKYLHNSVYDRLLRFRVMS